MATAHVSGLADLANRYGEAGRNIWHPTQGITYG